MCRPGWSVVLIAGYAEVMLQASLSLCGCSCLPCCEFCSCSIGSFACAWSSAGRVSAPASGACPAKGVAYGATAAQMTGECSHISNAFARLWAAHTVVHVHDMTRDKP